MESKWAISCWTVISYNIKWKQCMGCNVMSCMEWRHPSIFELPYRTVKEYADMQTCNYYTWNPPVWSSKGKTRKFKEKTLTFSQWRAVPRSFHEENSKKSVYIPQQMVFHGCFRLTYVFYVYECSVSMQARGGNQIPLQMVVSHHVGAGNWTQVLWKNSQCS